MNIIDKYYEAIQGIKDHISLPSDWDLITWDLCEEYYWCLTEDEDSVIFYKSIEDYQNDSEEENYYQTDIVTSEMWQNKSTLPANYTGIFKGKDYTGFLVDDPESIDEMIIAVFANRKNIENIEVLEPQMGFGKQETTISKTIKNKRENLGLSVEEILEQLNNVGLQLTLEKYRDIESGKSEPTGNEFLKIKNVLEF